MHRDGHRDRDGGYRDDGYGDGYSYGDSSEEAEPLDMARLEKATGTGVWGGVAGWDRARGGAAGDEVKVYDG